MASKFAFFVSSSCRKKNEKILHLLFVFVVVCLSEQNVNGQGPILQVNAILNENAFLPCDVISPIERDSATLVLWYKESEENPVYSFDKRKSIHENKTHWQDPVIFGGRAYFTVMSSPSGLLLRHIRESDAGFYRCRVDFIRSPTRNQKLRLNVIVPPNEPSIYDENGNNLTAGVTRPYEEGAEMVLNCVSQGGRPKPRLQWLHDGTLIESRKSTMQAADDPTTSSSSVTIKNMTRSHFRSTFTCQAVNNNVTAPASRNVTVNMFLAPSEVVILNNEINNQEHLSAGRTYKIECQALGSVPPAVITWWRNDQPFDHTSFKESNDTSVPKSILTLTPQREDNAVVIRCVATNPNVESWRKEASLKLNVQYSPVVSLELGPLLNPNDIEEGDDVYFICKIDANPLAYKLVWKHNDIEIQQKVKNEILVSDKSLVLRKVKKESIGNYTCVVSNVEGDRRSNSLELRVSYKPVCKPNQKLVYGAGHNEDIQVVCEVDSNPEPDKFQWSFNHSQEPISEKLYSRVEKRKGISILTFTPHSEMDFGYLTCAASNRVGKQIVPCHYQIIPAALPHSPHNCTIGNVTTVSLEIRCREGFDGGLPQNFWLEVINSTTGSVVLNTSSQEPYFKVNKLTPGNTIHVKIYAKNAKGQSSPLTLEGFTLKAEKHTGLQNSFVTPLVGIAGCVCLFIIVLTCIACLIKCSSSSSSSSLRKSSRRPTSLCIKEKTTHASLLENQEKDEKDPDLIPVKKNTGYQVLRTDGFEDEILRNSKLSNSNNQNNINVNDGDLVSDEEQLNFIDCTEKPSNFVAVKDRVSFAKGDNT